MSKFIFIILVILITNQPSFANPIRCSSLFLDNAQLNSATHSDSRIPSELRNLFNSTIKECDLILSKYFITEPPNIITAESNRSDASYDPLALRIYMAGKWSREPAILSHEYGHQIFMNNFDKLIPSWRALHAQLMKAENFRFTKLQPRIDSYRQAAKAYTSTPPSISREDYQAIKQERDDFENEYLRMKPNLPPEVDKAILLSLPYQELFSDLIAVLQSKNLKAVSEAFAKYGDPEANYYGENKKINPSEIFSRSFAKKTVLQQLRVKYLPSGSPHSILSQTREYIGLNLIFKYPAELITERVFKSIIMELQERLEDPSISPDKENLNRRLMEKTM